MGLEVSKKSTLRADKEREENLTKQVGTLAIERNTLGNKIGTLEREKGTLEREKDTLEREKGTLEREKDTLEREKGTLEREKGTLEREKDNLEREKAALEIEKQKAFEKEQARVLEEKTKILKKPWRKFESGGGWNREEIRLEILTPPLVQNCLSRAVCVPPVLGSAGTRYRNKLAQGIRSFKFHGNLKHSKLVLLGPINAGKSSFISSIASIDKDVISQPTLAGSATSSVTKRLHQYIPKKHLAGKYRLMDSMGIEETEEQGFHIQNVIYLLEGNIAPDYEFKSGEIITPHDNPKYIKHPLLIDKPQCIVIVTDSNILDLDAFSNEVQKKIRKLQDYIREHVVPVVLVLTKIDEICADEGIQITDIYVSRRIQTIITRATSIFGVPLMNIYPVQNYSKEEELEDNIDILLLLALRGILRIASDHLEYLDDQTR